MKMTGLAVFKEAIEEGEKRFTASLIEVENAVIAFFGEEEVIKLGTLTIAAPQRGGEACISSVLLGERNVLITKILAEHLGRAFNKIALVSSHLTEVRDPSVGSLLIRLNKKLIEKARTPENA